MQTQIEQRIDLTTPFTVKASKNLPYGHVEVVVSNSATDTGIKGQVAWDSSYIYVCVSDDAWKRTALSSW